MRFLSDAQRRLLDALTPLAAGNAHVVQEGLKKFSIEDSADLADLIEYIASALKEEPQHSEEHVSRLIELAKELRSEQGSGSGGKPPRDTRAKQAGSIAF